MYFVTKGRQKILLTIFFLRLKKYFFSFFLNLIRGHFKGNTFNLPVIVSIQYFKKKIVFKNRWTFKIIFLKQWF